MDCSVKPIKKFFTSLYYANKKLDMAPKKMVKFGDSISERLISKVSPYIEGYEQLANKHRINIYPNSCGERDFITIGDKKMINIPKDMTAPEVARKVYKTVSESLKDM